MKRLSAMAGAAVLLGAGQGSAQPCSVDDALRRGTSPLVEAAAAELGSDAELETGAAGDAVVRAFVEWACTEPDVVGWAPGSCAIDSGGLVILRRRLVADVARAPSRALERRAATLSPEAQRTSRLGVALIDALLLSPTLPVVARRLARDPGAGIALPNLCARRDSVLPLRTRVPTELRSALAAPSMDLPGALPPLAPLTELRDSVQRLGVLLERLASSPDRTGPGLARAAARELLGRDPASEGEIPPLARRLGQSIVELDAATRSLQGASGPSLRDAILRALRALALILEDGSELLGEPRPPLQPWVDFAELLLRADVAAALDALRRIAEVGTAAPDALVEKVRFGARLLAARSIDEAERIIRSLLLGPWSEPWLFGLGVGAVSLAERDVSLAGDALLGYSGERFGVLAHGSLGYYDLTEDQVVSSTAVSGGGGEAWVVIPAATALGVEVRIEGSGMVYDSDLIDLRAGQTTVFTEETSLMARGGLLAGVRYEPDARAALGVWLGGGVQYEFYDPTRVGVTGVSLGEVERTSVALSARVRAEHRVVPDWLALRLRLDALRHDITRDSLEIQVSGAGVQSTTLAEDSVQLEVGARLFADAEVARFAGFVPGIFGGIDYFARSGTTSPTLVTTVPIAGVAMRRAAF